MPSTPVKPTSNRAAIGCVLALVLLPAGCVAYFAAKGQSHTSGTSAPAADTPAAPAGSAAPSPAQMLANLDGGVRPVADYQAALDALGPKCTQDAAHIAGLGDAGYKDLVKNGVTDETRLTVLRHLSDSIPASLGRTDCAGILSGYLVLREQG
jgi:hypothetical protein